MKQEINQKLWIVTELFYPEETASAFYLTGIAEYLCQYRAVNVICGGDIYENETRLLSNKKELKNINIFRLGKIGLGKNNLFSRVLRFLYLTFGLCLKIVSKVAKNEEVWVVTNPAFLVPFAVILSKLIKFKLVILVHDVFPENTIPLNLLNPNRFVYNLLKKIFDTAYLNADKIIVCGRDMENLFIEKVGGKKEKIGVIENWADIEDVFPQPTNNKDIYGIPNISDKIIFQYAGNIGRLQGLEELVDIIANCQNPNLYFVFLGEGALKQKLINKINAEKITNISILNSFSRKEQNSYLNACDVAIVSLYDEMIGLGVPSKSYNIMASGKPILYIGNSKGEIGMCVKDYNIGWQFEWINRAEIEYFLNSFKADFIADKRLKSRNLAENRFAKKIILSKYRWLLEGKNEVNSKKNH